MSNKSSGIAQTISLPKGGGALHGIGEKFSPDIFTGTGNFTVPIAVPPGRNGFQPQLNLVYSTGNGNGPYGLGWNLSIPGIMRKTSGAKGIPVYGDATDVFILSGAEDLVPVDSESAGITQYRPRTEGLFARIRHRHDAKNDFWKVEGKDGLVSFYGSLRPEDAGPNWIDPAVISDPDQPAHGFAWKLTRTVDSFGNRIDYLYERDALRSEGPHHWDQLYLSAIRYVDYGDPAAPQFLVTVKFTYENRPDPFSEYRSGFEIRTVRRCSKIEILTDGAPPALTRTYHLDYLDQIGPPGKQLPANWVSLLSRVRVVGHDGAATEALPPLEFGYTGFEPGRRDFFPLSGPDLPPSSLANPNYELVDLFGNGLPDILELNGTSRYWRNLGNGRFDRPQAMAAAPAGLRLADQGVQLIDANGDGRVDLLVSTDEMAGYYPLQFGGLWDHRSFQRYRKAPTFDLEDPEVRLVDLDGDGVTDAIRSGTRLDCFFNDPREGWNRTRRVERRAPDVFPNVKFSDPRVRLADMTGDGLQDIALVYDGNVEYWPHLGYGNWGRRVSMRNCPHFPFNYDPRRILIGDVDGDGLADIVYVDDTKVTLWINQSGNRWSDPIEISGTPPVSDMDGVRLADVLGNGVGGILWSRDADGSSRERMFFLDFTRGVKPYLLSEMDNHMGAVTRVGYAPSTRFYLEDGKRVETRWKTSLPFAVQLVAWVEVIDAISGGKLTTGYRYHHGFWDGVEREFRGFGRVDQHDTELFTDYHSPGLHPARPFRSVDLKAFSLPTETRTWFHQGPVGDEFGSWEELKFDDEFWQHDSQVLSRPPAISDFLNNLPRRVRRDAVRTLRGSVLRIETYALDGTGRQERPYTVTEHVYGVRSLRIVEPWSDQPEAWRLQVFFPYPDAQRTTQWERGNDPMTTFQFMDEYDEHGQARSQIKVAVPRGRVFQVEVAAAEPYLGTYTQLVFAKPDDAERYLTDRVARITTREIRNDGTVDVFTLRDRVSGGGANGPIVTQTFHFYDGPAFEGLPFGRVGNRGALMRTKNLVFTKDVLRRAYESNGTVFVPPYLEADGPLPWPTDYPAQFRDKLLPLAGYAFEQGGVDSPYESGYFTASERLRYDFQEVAAEGKGRGLVETRRDPLGHDVLINYDSFDFLPENVTDAIGLTTSVINNYRVMQPQEVTDPNGNRAISVFTPLGLLRSTALVGKEDETIGDTLSSPSLQLEYDFAAFDRSHAENRQPISVRLIQRVHHKNDVDIPLVERDDAIESVEYSDGFGRLLQSRGQAADITFGDPAFGANVLSPDQADDAGTRMVIVGRKTTDPSNPNVVVSGWQIYDNKGRVVEKYEPFFSKGWGYAPPAEEKLGQKAIAHYDPGGRVILMLNPDGSEQRIVHGVPGTILKPDLTNPEVFEPTPWESYTYDANDNAGRTHPDASKAYPHHWDTPASALVDALGRPIETVARNRYKPTESGPFPLIEAFRTRSTYDIAGNLLTVIDPLDRLAFRCVYDLSSNPLRIESIDAGIRHIVLDAMGSLIEQRDSKGALILNSYDKSNRSIRVWARDGHGQDITLREHLVYGDQPESGLTLAQARAANLRGKQYLHFDEAGLLILERYDFKGNELEKRRQVISDAAILSIEAFRVDWQPPDGTTLSDNASRLLDKTTYQTSYTFDALNQVTAVRCPEDAEGIGKRKGLQRRFNRAGALERVQIAETIFVKCIIYNAKGQRTLIVYGNGVMTRYAYDTKTFRLLRMRSERCEEVADLTYRPSGAPLQDFAYEYDLAGNITALHDRTPGSGVPDRGADALDRAFSYDALYRLLSATGRECDMPLSPPWADTPRCTDLTKTRGYVEEYLYDPVGNITRMHHRINGGGFTRQFSFAPGNNRLVNMNAGTSDYRYKCDANGNVIKENNERHFQWDQGDRLRRFRNQVEDTQPTVDASYLYNAVGQRVKKVVRKAGKIEATVYIETIFEHMRIVLAGSIEENNTLHVMDNASRVAMVRVGVAFAGDKTSSVKYHLGDYLGSSNVVVDQSAIAVNTEEYTPYGETSFGSFAKKRYRFTGKERDEESGLAYHETRYYAPWLGRWISADPALLAMDRTRTRSVPDRAESLFSYARNDPLGHWDLDGRQAAAPDINQLSQEAAEKAEDIMRVLTTHHAWTKGQGTFLGTLAEAQGGELVKSGKFGGGKSSVWSHASSLRQGKTALQDSLTALRNVLEKVRNVNPTLGSRVTEGFKPLITKASENIQLAQETEDLAYELALHHPDRLGKAPLLEGGGTTLGQLKNLGTRLLPGGMETGKYSTVLDRIKQLPSTAAEAVESVKKLGSAIVTALSAMGAQASAATAGTASRAATFFRGVVSAFTAASTRLSTPMIFILPKNLPSLYPHAEGT